MRDFNKWLIPILVVLGLLAVIGYARADWSISGMNRQIDQTNFLVNNNCSATLIDAKRGLLLTANHCVDAQFRTIEREKIENKGVITRSERRGDPRFAELTRISEIATPPPAYRDDVSVVSFLS